MSTVYIWKLYTFYSLCRIETETTQEELRVRIIKCWATDQQDPGKQNKITMLENSSNLPTNKSV